MDGPRAPPLPPTTQRPDVQPQLKLRSEVSPFIQKLQAAATGYGFQADDADLPIAGPRAPTLGWYFVYGSLMDPSLLSEILSLDTKPTLCRAKVLGYALKLWGQYPALLDGQPGEEVYGMAFKVDEQRHADRLVEYETKAYRPGACLIRFITKDGSDGEAVEGSVFKYDGDPNELSDCQFDLDSWLKLIGRSRG
ncbi:hypothetical protein DV737_g5031, partial [Chaetothyriales sp. CBS 132003]